MLNVRKVEYRMKNITSWELNEILEVLSLLNDEDKKEMLAFLHGVKFIKNLEISQTAS